MQDQERQGVEFDKLVIQIASDDVIRNDWSRGEIKKPETINYRTFKPKKGASFVKKYSGRLVIGNVHAENTKR